MRYKLLVIDIDGTLVNSRDELTEPTRQALARAVEAGIHVVLATGRRYRRSRPLVESLGIVAPLITASGTLVKDPATHRTLYRAEFKRESIIAASRIMVRLGFEPIWFVDAYDEGARLEDAFEFYCTREEVLTGEAGGPDLGQYIAAGKKYGRVWPDLIENPPDGIYTGFAMGSFAQMTELAATLEKEHPSVFYTHVIRSPQFVPFICEISPAGATKWSAVELLAEGWGIKDWEICAVGDDVNDIDMIRYAGLGVAMDNALPAVKEAADRIAPGHDHDGLVEVVNWLLSCE
jgi:Cof subfamily protein (haloacid dehalogenase superfamily)